MRQTPRSTPEFALWRLRRLFWAGGVALVVIAATVAGLELARSRTASWVQRTRETTRLAREGQILATERAAAVRGFLLSGDPRLLAPDERARSLLPQKLDSLSTLTKGDRASTELVLAVRMALDRWEREVATPIADGVRSGRAPTSPSAIALGGVPVFDAVRVAFTALIDAEYRLYQERMQRHTTLRAAGTAAAFVGIVVIVVVLIVLRRDVISQTTRLLYQQALLEAQTRDAQAVAESAHAAEERYRSLVDGLAVGVVLMDAAEGIVAANPSAERILGLSADQMRGRSSLDPRWRTVHEDSSPFSGEEHPVVISLRTGEPRSNIIMGVHRPDDTLVWIEISSRALYHPGEDVPYAAVASFIDLTERKRLEGHLVRAQRMEAVGQLAGGVAHDFNNMLTVISGYTAILLESDGMSATDREDLTEIKRAAERASGLTRQLLAFSRKQVLQPRVLDLNVEVIPGLEKMLRRLIGEDIELVTALDERTGLVNADPGQVEQVIVNLAVNARDAMPAGGRIRIETTNVDLQADDDGRHIGAQPGRYVMIAVSDTGTGMGYETLAHMFEPFFTTKEKGRGTGLGLATVYGIVKQSSGDISIDSQLGRGTTFKVYFPRVAEPAGTTLLPAPAATGGGGCETILLVEDDETLRSLSRRVLQGRGYTILEAKNGADALSLSERYEHRIDLVATDIVMPGMNGHTLAERLASRRPSIRILFMSGYTDDDVLRRGIADPRMALLQKPFTPEALASKVREVLDSSISPAVPSLPLPGSPAPVSR
jgi:PAS domain S-box-containing protein